MRVIYSKILYFQVIFLRILRRMMNNEEEETWKEEIPGRSGEDHEKVSG